MLRQSNVKLIGEPFPELTLSAPGGLAQDGPAATQFLRTQVTAANAQFARIYGFSFEGHYYDLPRPVIMLVHGGGTALPNPPGAAPTIAQSDEAARLWEFSGNLFEWNYDKMSMSIRLDLDSGTLEKILLERALAGGPGAYGGGAYGGGAYGGGAYGGGAYGGGAYGGGAYGGGAYGAGPSGRARRGGGD